MSVDSLSLQLSHCLNARRWLIAYSGGVDSHVLLHALVAYQQQLADTQPLPRIVAVHINHQLQTDADQWAEHCRSQAALLGVEYLSIEVDIDTKDGASLEKKAREARYSAFETLLAKGDVLMMGHHLDDQVETLLLRLLRGSGVSGNSSMPQSRPLGKGVLNRPLLETSRHRIEDYARQHALKWVEDPSNASPEFDRNFLRLKLLPLLEERWPEYRKTLSRAALLNQESAALNEQLAVIDAADVMIELNADSIEITALAQLDESRQKNLLRFWLKQRGLPMPSVAQLKTMLSAVMSAKDDAVPLLEWGGLQARRFKHRLYVFPALEPIDPATVYDWDLNEPLALLSGSQLCAHQTLGEGVSAAKLQGHPIEVRFRQGGERCQPVGRGGSQTLKKLFQEYAVETWLRDRTPLLYVGDTLVAVADQWVCEGWQASANEKAWLIEWKK